MKKLILSVIAVVFLAGVGSLMSVARGQAPAARPAAIPHKVGMIDMAFLFSNYKKFEVLRDDLRQEIEATEQKLKGTLEQINALTQQLKSNTFAQGSKEFVERETKITQLSTQIEADRKTAQRDFFRKESKIYQTIYLEVADTVAKYAEARKYTLILRFNRDEDNSEDPQKVMQSLQRQVVYYRPEDDITQEILEYLNGKYQPEGAPKTTPAPAGGVPRTTTPKTGAPR